MAHFSDIIGQDMIKEHLQGALAAGKTSHAYIIQDVDTVDFSEVYGQEMVKRAAEKNLLLIFLQWHYSAKNREPTRVVNVPPVNRHLVKIIRTSYVLHTKNQIQSV